MNKLLVIEGTDNSGKDLLISKFLKDFKNVEVRHFDRPLSQTNGGARLEQNAKFYGFCQDFNEDLSDRILICNRAWYGEYVYGTLYRERTKKDVIDMINYCEDILSKTNTDVTFIMLYAEPELLEKNDDGQSLSEGKIETIKKESNLFREVFDKSNIKKKLLIEVTKDGEFIDEFDIYKQAKNLFMK